MRSRSLRCSSQVLLTALRIAACLSGEGVARFPLRLEQLGRARASGRASGHFASASGTCVRALRYHMKRSGLLILQERVALCDGGDAIAAFGVASMACRGGRRNDAQRRRILQQRQFLQKRPLGAPLVVVSF